MLHLPERQDEYLFYAARRNESVISWSRTLRAMMLGTSAAEKSPNQGNPPNWRQKFSSPMQILENRRDKQRAEYKVQARRYHRPKSWLSCAFPLRMVSRNGFDPYWRWYNGVAVLSFFSFTSAWSKSRQPPGYVLCVHQNCAHWNDSLDTRSRSQETHRQSF